MNRRPCSPVGKRWLKRKPLSLESLESRNLLAGDLAITEINYNPYDPTDAEFAAGHDNNDAFEFIEFKNVGDADLSLGNWDIVAGVTFAFSNTTLAPGEIAVVVRDQAAFSFRYDTSGVRILGEYSGSLSNSGEVITLAENNIGIIDFEYKDTGAWPTRADGDGSTLELANPDDTIVSLYRKSYSWRSSTEFGGSPGHENMGQIGIVINEILAHTDAPITPPDSIELLNVSDAPIDIGGWYLSDDGMDLHKYQIPANTIVQPGHFIVFDETHFNPTPANPGDNDFRLSSVLGDDVWLTVGDGGDGVSLFADVAFIPPSLNSESYGRVVEGSPTFAPLMRLSLGCENAQPRMTPLVISEINYDPIEPSADALIIDPTLSIGDLEFIELHNSSGVTMSLTEWRIRGDADFDFAEGKTIAPGETLILVSFTPDDVLGLNKLEAFRVHYSMPSTVRVMGPFTGNLSNSEGRVTLQFPDEPPATDPTVYPRITGDEVIYDDIAPWPKSADGGGSSLQRMSPTFYGNSAFSWRGTAPTPGFAIFPGSVPGDLNGDSLVDANDIDYLQNHVRRLDPSLAFDINGNFVVELGDVTRYLSTVLQTRLGDANLNGVVDASDFNIWNAHKFQSCNMSWADGDFTGDGEVDVSDFNRWFANKFTMGPVGAVVAAGEAPRAADTISTSPSEPWLNTPPVIVSASMSTVEQKSSTNEGRLSVTGLSTCPNTSHLNLNDAPGDRHTVRRTFTNERRSIRAMPTDASDTGQLAASVLDTLYAQLGR
ncbi:MAG: lamin tail domain-containing protein [Planctomycetales bacterium]|nr:lamin tail domain-containing protein [Planctomycetales bacterium]